MDLREFNFLSMCLRMLIAAVAGGMVGYGRSRNQQAAGLRTHIITCVGACLATMLTFYEYEMLTGAWANTALVGSIKFDASRYAAAVLGGMGFIASGSIIRIAHQQISGLTTAIGMFVTACIGVAAGIGFYEVVAGALFMLIFTLEGMSKWEGRFKQRLHHMTLCVTFDDLQNLTKITDCLRECGSNVYEIELEPSAEGSTPSALIWARLKKKGETHASLISAVAELPCVYSVQELIS